MTERQHCTTCTMLLKQKENATSIFHDGTILSSCLTTCNVDFVTRRPNTSRNFNCTRDRTTLVRKDLSKPAMGGWRVAKRATPEGEESSARDSKLPKSGGNGSMKASARSAASGGCLQRRETGGMLHNQRPRQKVAQHRRQSRAQERAEECASRPDATTGFL